VCIYFHSESSQKNTRMPELDTASHVVRLVRYDQRHSNNFRVMNNIGTPHFLLCFNLLHFQKAILTGYRCDRVKPDFALTEYINPVTDVDHNRKTGVTGSYALFYRQGISPTAQEL
jgi:hypothetical protein